jgi:hypothetical protein
MPWFSSTWREVWTPGRSCSLPVFLIFSYKTFHKSWKYHGAYSFPQYLQEYVVEEFKWHARAWKYICITYIALIIDLGGRYMYETRRSMSELVFRVSQSLQPPRRLSSVSPIKCHTSDSYNDLFFLQNLISKAVPGSGRYRRPRPDHQPFC